MLAKLAQLAKLRISDREGGAFGGQRDFFGEEDETSSEEEDESMEIYGEADIDNSLESIESMEDDLMESSLNLSTTSLTSSSSILETDCPGGCNFLFVNSDLTDEVIVIAIIIIIIIIIIITRPKPPFGRQGLAGPWGKDTVRRVHFGVFSTSCFAHRALSSESGGLN